MFDRTRSSGRRTLALTIAVAAASAAAVVPAMTPAVAAAPAFTKIEGAAANAAGLTPTVNAYRSLLGDPNNASAPGSQPAGRREINWDGTPDAQSAPNLLPANFFNTTVPRGAVFGTWSGNKFQVSADSANPTNTAVRFGNLNASYPATFGTFSAERLFTPLGTNTMKVNFFVPGSTTPATVKGFGAVFTDVDRGDSTKIELYDRWGTRLWWQYVPKGPVAHKSLSFLGVTSTADIYEARITTGNAPLHANNRDGVDGRDLVVMDDFLYGEPKPLH